jgi:energy-coupling factor transporter ATP-binding protein EcfA2
MVFELQENDVIKKQNIEITETMMGIYGYNNSGKTTVLRELDKIIDKENWGCIVNEGQYIRSLFIPTNRVIVREAYTSSASVKDLEDFLAYKRDSYKEYDLHLRIIRADLLQNDAVRQIIKKAIKYMFGGDYEFDFSNRQSDGVENIINIYCNIIWLFTWDKDIENIKADELSQYLRSTSAVIMIDEIEAFLHVYVQSRMLQKFKDDFSKCSFVFTTHSPLLLSRYYDIRKFQLENGLLNEVNADLYYKDLDNIYEVYFNVDEFPGEARKIINRLGDYILGDEYDKDAVAKDLKILNEKYVNIKDKYPGLVTKAERKLGVK